MIYKTKKIGQIFLLLFIKLLSNIFYISFQNVFCPEHFSYICLVLRLEIRAEICSEIHLRILSEIHSHKYNKAIQIQIGNTNTTWQHRYNRATQLQHGDTNKIYEKNTNFLTQNQLGDTNTVVAFIMEGIKVSPTQAVAFVALWQKYNAPPKCLPPWILSLRKVWPKNFLTPPKFWPL